MSTTTAPPRAERRRHRWRRALAVTAALSSAVLAGPASAATVDAGNLHTCAVTDSHAVACWGDNSSGQLGDGTFTSAARPVTATGVSDATEVAVSNSASCALQSAGTVRCWGSNAGGALGDNTGVSSSTAVEVAGLADAVAIENVASRFCALRTGGRVSCWGGVFSANDVPGASYAPQELEGVSGALDISGAETELCIVWSTVTKCRATLVKNEFGGGVPPAGTVDLPASADIQKLDSTPWAFFDGCAVLSSGQVSCWGSNSQGQLGNGVTNNRPLERGQSLVLGISDARSVFMAFGTSCALRENGEVSCWGTSSDLPPGGVPTATPATTPVVRNDLSGTIAITGADHHACATTTARAVKCWGFNGSGQLGDGTQINRPTAVTVAGLKVAASERDAVTPVRRGEPDITVPAPVQGTTPGTTPGGTTPNGTTPWPTTPTGTTPNGTTPWPTTPTGTTPGPGGIDPGGYPPLGLPTILFKDGVLILADFKVAPLRSGRCPKRALVNVRAGRISMARTFKVSTTTDGRCSVSGWIRLGRRLASSRVLTVTVGAPGAIRAIQRVTRTR